MKAYSLFSIVITSLGSNLETPLMLVSTFIDSATDADAEPISNCCGACAGEEVMVVLKEFVIVSWEPCLGSLVHDLSHQ